MLEGLTPLHLVVILVIALVILGPGKLPEVAAALGKSIREFRRAATDVREATSLEPSPTPAATVAPSATAPVAPAAPPPVAAAAPAFTSGPTAMEPGGPPSTIVGP